MGLKGCGSSPKSYFAKHFDETNHQDMKESSDVRQLQCDISALGNHFQPMQWCSFTGMGRGSRRSSQNNLLSGAKPLQKVKRVQEPMWQHEL